jgi:hypothetical protein
MAIQFFIDVDNKRRIKIQDGEHEDLKSDIKLFRSQGVKFTFDIRNLGILEVDTVFASAKERACIIKTTLVLDYSGIATNENGVVGWESYEFNI